MPRWLQTAAIVFLAAAESAVPDEPMFERHLIASHEKVPRNCHLLEQFHDSLANPLRSAHARRLRALAANSSRRSRLFGRSSGSKGSNRRAPTPSECCDIQCCDARATAASTVRWAAELSSAYSAYWPRVGSKIATSWNYWPRVIVPDSMAPTLLPCCLPKPNRRL